MKFWKILYYEYICKFLYIFLYFYIYIYISIQWVRSSLLKYMYMLVTPVDIGTYIRYTGIYMYVCKHVNTRKYMYRNKYAYVAKSFGKPISFHSPISSTSWQHLVQCKFCFHFMSHTAAITHTLELHTKFNTASL